MMIAILGIIDLIAGTVLILSPDFLIPNLTKGIGIILIIKGLWSIAAGAMSK